MYYLPSYEFWYLQEFVFEFPQHDTSHFRVNTDVYEVTEKAKVSDKKNKEIFVLDLCLMGNLYFLKLF